ncbi:MAG: hypothetical protein ABL971_16800 [Vicinamibacterales bacterium]
MRSTTHRPGLRGAGTTAATPFQRRRAHRALGLAAAAVLALTLSGCGEGMNSSADPALQSESPEEDSMDGMDMGDDMGDMDHGDAQGDGHMHSHETEGDGLSASLRGLTLGEVETNATSESGGELSFRIVKENGTTATEFVRDQGKYVHAYLVSEDLSTYHHVHPKAAAGNWVVNVPPLPAGRVHLVTNFVAVDAEGEYRALTLGTDFNVAGEATAKPLPKPAPEVQVDGYTVTLGEAASVGAEAKLNLTVTKGGRPVTFEPYLEAWAHTSAFAAGTQAISHLHPAQEWKPDATPPEVLTFVWTPSAAGDYRFFVEFMAEGELHRAEFTRTVSN